MADRVTIADVAADADTRLAAAFSAPWKVHAGGPPDVVSGGAVWAEVVAAATPAAAPTRAEAVTVRYVAAVRSRTGGPERADQLDALDRFLLLAAGWPACTRHLFTVENVAVGGVDTAAVVAVLIVTAPPC